MHRNSVLIKIQPDATVCRYLFTAKSLYMFRVSQHPSSGVLKTVTAACGTGHNTGTATSLQRGLQATLQCWGRRGSTSCVRGQEIVSFASQGVRFMCIIRVTRCPLHVYHSRHKVSASRVSVASQGVRFTCISCVPRCPLHVYQLRPAVSWELHQLHRKIRVYRMSNSWKVFTQSYCTLL